MEKTEDFEKYYVEVIMQGRTDDERSTLPLSLYKENTRYNIENRDVDKFIGFNLRNLSQLRFRNYDQIVDELVKRLEAHYGV